MDDIESYVVAMFFVLLSGFFSGGAGKYLSLYREGTLSEGMSPWVGVYVPFCGLVSGVYAILWALAINHKFLVMLPYIVAWFLGVYIGNNVYGSSNSWKTSLAGLLVVPVSYHLVSPHVTQQYPFP